MRRLVMTLAAMGLALCAAPYARTELLPDLPKTDKLEAAKTAEMKGDLARAHENYWGAVGYYQQALRADPQNAALYNKLGIAELKLHNRGPARKQFNQALKYDPRNVSALNNLGAVAFLDKKYKPAVHYLKKALELDESSAPSHLNLAEAWMGMGEVDHAMNEYARALELDADILSSGQEGVVAQVSTPEQRARVSYLIAKAYAKRGNLEGALEYLRRAKDGNYPLLASVYTDKDFLGLWQDPRLSKIVRR
ncbi:MAG: tetratricopeptide repeat protein [Terracidiphilus sp.]